MASTITSNGQFVAETDGPGEFSNGLGRTVARIWCWREFTLPAAVIGIAYSTHSDVGLTAALAVVIAGLLLLFARPRIIASAFDRCSARSRILSRQIAWPGTCEQLGWGRRLASGGRLVPALLGWAEDEHQVRVLVRPLPEQGPRAWDQMADALRRMVGGASVEWRESRGTLTVLVSRHGLPSKLIWSSGASDAGRIVLGHRRGGAALALDVVRTPHVLLAGATGSGKGGAIRAALAGALESGWQAVVIDPKESGEYRWLDDLGVPVVSDIVEQIRVLQEIDVIRHGRQSRIKEFGAETWHQLPDLIAPGWRPLLVVIDEAADLLVQVKGRSAPEREYVALQQEASRLITQLARKGRSAGIHLIVAIQRPDTAQLGDGGGALRNNLTARLALGSLDAEGIRMLGIATGDPVVTTLDGTPGRGICVGFGDNPRPSACQVAWLDQRQAIEQVRPTVPQGVEEIAPFSVYADETTDEIEDGE